MPTTKGETTAQRAQIAPDLEMVTPCLRTYLRPTGAISPIPCQPAQIPNSDPNKRSIKVGQMRSAGLDPAARWDDRPFSSLWARALDRESHLSQLITRGRGRPISRGDDKRSWVPRRRLPQRRWRRLKQT